MAGKSISQLTETVRTRRNAIVYTTRRLRPKTPNTFEGLLLISGAMLSLLSQFLHFVKNVGHIQGHGGFLNIFSRSLPSELVRTDEALMAVEQRPRAAYRAQKAFKALKYSLSGSRTQLSRDPPINASMTGACTNRYTNRDLLDHLYIAPIQCIP